MKRLLIIIALAALTGCDHEEPTAQVPGPLTSEPTESAKKEEERVIQLAVEILQKYKTAGNQLIALEGYLTGRRTILLQKEHQDYSQRKKLQGELSSQAFEIQESLRKVEWIAFLDREITASNVVMGTLSGIIRKLETLQNDSLDEQVFTIFESAPGDTGYLESLSEIHFQIVVYLGNLDTGLTSLSEHLNTQFPAPEAKKKMLQRDIAALEAAIEIEIASFVAIGKRQAQGDIIERMCGTTIQDSARREINKLKGQIIGAEIAAIEIEYVKEVIKTLKSSLNSHP